MSPIPNFLLKCFCVPNWYNHQCDISIQGRAYPHQMQVSIIFSKYLYHHWKAWPIDSNCSKLLAYINISYYVQKIMFLLKPLQHRSGNMSLSVWNFWKIWVRWRSNFDNLPAVEELYFWYLSFSLEKKEMEIVPWSPKIKSDSKAACFIPYMYIAIN